MSIYRGPGGAGDAITDASSEATLVAQLVAEATAAKIAAEDAETGAQSSETSAATSATAASNSATAAADSATASAASAASIVGDVADAEAAAASALTSKNAAASSATTATTQATNAATSASSASTSATSASTSASNAATSASSASTSATNAASSVASAVAIYGNITDVQNAAASANAAYDSFDDRYLGAKSTAPTVDNDGNTLLVGALYYDTPAAIMKVWSGTAWFAAYASSSGGMLSANNLSDVADVAASRTNLGLGTTDSPQFANLGIGTAPSATVNLVVSADITGGVTAYNIYSGPTIRSGVTTLASNNLSIALTEAAAFTLATFRHYDAVSPSIGAGSAITTQVGYGARALSGATNNYAFQGAVAAATGAYNLYMNGTANNYLAGSLTIGGAPSIGINLKLNKTITGATTAYGFTNQCTVQSDVTAGVTLNYSGLSTAAASFTVSTATHYSATQEAFGAGSAVTTQTAFLANAFSGATNNYGFYGNIAAATGRYNLYMTGTAANYLAGITLIGTLTNTLSGQLVSSGQIIETTGSTQYNIASQYDIGTNPNQIPLNQYLGTLAFQNSEAISGGTATFTSVGVGTTTMSQSLNVTAVNGTGFAGQRITNNNANIGIAGVEFSSDSTYAKAAIGLVRNSPNGVGILSFYNSASTGAADWNTSDARLVINGNGNIGIGGVHDATNKVLVSGVLPSSAGGTGGIRISGTIPSTTTSVYVGFDSIPYTTATAFTVGTIYQYRAYAPQIGAGSSVNNNMGYFVDATNTTATNNFAFYGNIAAATGRWNIYAGGTAANYLAGNLGIGTATTTAAQLTVAGSASIAALKVPNIKEVITVSATAATGTIQYDITTQSVLYYTTNASANWTVNFRGSSGTSLDTLMATGETMSATFMVTQGTTAYYNSAVTIDGTAVTPKWVGGSAPTSGNVSSIESYTYAIIKTGAATFTVLASRTKFA